MGGPPGAWGAEWGDGREMKPAFTFDPEAHVYTLNGRRVPSVTEILNVEFPMQWRATEFHLGRGRIVHQCAALVMRGVDFTHDPRIGGQVQALKTWKANLNPKLVLGETPLCSPLHYYAGTPDLVADIHGEIHLVDWKASLCPLNQWQLGAYALLLQEAAVTVKRAYPVWIRDDGTYQVGREVNLKAAIREWLNIRSVFGLREREKLIGQQEDAA